MTLKEAIQKDGQRHLYVKSAITSETTQYVNLSLKLVEKDLHAEKKIVESTEVICWNRDSRFFL